MFDAAFARSHFPALASGWALFDNAGGTAVARQVIERVTAYLSRYGFQIGASYAPSVEAAALVEEGRRAMAALLGAEPEEVLLGPSTTFNTLVLARALAPALRPGDEVVVTNLDHESNIGAFRRLSEHGLVVKEWRFRPETLGLELEDLERLLTERTRLVCFTQVSNVAGKIHDAAAICRRVREAGAWSVVDGVAFAPHRRVDVRALGADFYLVSLYKIFGPHQALLYGRRERLEGLAGVNHYFLADLPARLQPAGSVNYELAAGLPGILDYFDAIAGHHCDWPAGGQAEEEPRRGEPDGAAPTPARESVGSARDEHRSGARERLAAAFDLCERREEALLAPLVAYLRGKRGVSIVGPATADRRERVAILSFTVEGRDAAEIPPLLAGHRIGVRSGHFYVYRGMRDLGLLARGGVVRVSLAHYNTAEEIERLIAALEAVL
jgi:selenocysteine lyase/cysteine desulfurase